MQHKSLPGWLGWDSANSMAGDMVPNKLPRQISSSKNVIRPRPVKASSLYIDYPRKPSPTMQYPYSALVASKNCSDYNSSEDNSQTQVSSSAELTRDKNFLNIRRREHPGHRRSLSNQSISIRNEGQTNEIVLKSSVSDQNLIFQNDNYSDATGQYNQSLLISAHEQDAGSNILISNKAQRTGTHLTRIETTNNGDETNSILCVKNASNEYGDGATHSSVFYKRSRNAALPKIPTVSNYKQCVLRGVTAPPLPRPQARMEGSASLDGFQQQSISAATGRSRAKYVNEMLLPRGGPLICPSTSYAAGASNLSRQAADLSVVPDGNCKNVLSATYEPYIAHAVKDLIEYDNDTGWKRRSMPINLLSSLVFEEPIKGEPHAIRNVTAESRANTKSSERYLIESMPKSEAGFPTKTCLYEKDIMPASTNSVPWHSDLGPKATVVKRRHRKSQSGLDASRDNKETALNFGEYYGKTKEARGPKVAPKGDLEMHREIKNSSNGPEEVHNSADSIKNIIDEERSKLLAKSNTHTYLSDESQLPDPVFEKTSDYKKTDIKDKSRMEARGPENTAHSDCDEDVSDDVFQSPYLNGRNASFSAKIKKKSYPKRRTSSLEDLAKFQKRLAEVNKSSRSKSADGSSRKTSSSVSINETPQVFTYDKSLDSFKTPKSMNRRSKTNSSSSLNNGLALLNTKPTRGSLKTPAVTPSNSSMPKPSASKSKSSSKMGKTSKTRGKQSNNISSEYDPRERRRDGNGNERDLYRCRERGDRDKDLSDREQKDSQNDSFNRSLSNTEGTPDDKIGK